MDAPVWSVTPYGSETWTMKQEDIRRLEDLEMWIWRRTKKTSWTGHVTNEVMLAGIREDRAMIHPIRKRIGHILKGDSLPRTVIEGKTERKKRRGRPKQMMLNRMMADGYGKLKTEVQLREEWRCCILKPAKN